KTRDELPEHVLKSGMVSYIKKKQDKMLTDEEVKAIVEQIESNRFSKSWRTNRAHKAYLKEKHSPSNKQPSDKPNVQSVTTSANQPASELIVKQPLKRTILQSREVLRWSGQTEVEAGDAPFVPSSKVLPISQLNNDDSVFITPFEVLESEPK